MSMKITKVVDGKRVLCEPSYSESFAKEESMRLPHLSGQGL